MMKDGAQDQKEEAVVNREIETTVREDGSRTTTTIITRRLADGSTTVQRETVHLPPPSSSSSPSSPVPAKASTSIGTAPPTMKNPSETAEANKDKKQRGPLFVASLMAALLMVVLGFVATAKTAQSNLEENEDYEADAETAQKTGAVSIVAAVAAIPLAFCEANRYDTAGNRCLMVAGWILYGFGIANAVGILVASFEEDTEIHASVVSTQVVLLLIAYICMISYAETRRRS